MDPSARAAWANRTASAAIVAAYLAASARAVPDADARASLHYAVVTAVGYGHLLGAARLPGRGLAARASWALGIANAFALYALALAWLPEVALLLLAASAWHAAENDLALGAAYANGHRPAPHARSARTLAASGAAAAAVVGAAGCALAGIPLGPLGALSFGDVFAAATLHHLVSFALLLAARARAVARRDAAAGARLAARLAAWHAGPALALALLPFAGAGGAALRAALVAPPFYLFCSALHVAQTTWQRGLAR